MFNMDMPIPYTLENVYNSARHPSAMHAEQSGLARYFQRYLIQKIISAFEFDNIPDNWDKSYFYYSLFVWGYVAVVNTNKYGVIPQWCTLKGRGVFWEPTGVIISNPLIKVPNDLKIGRDCALIRMQPDYGGAWDIVTYYADIMALSSETVATNLINSKLAYVFFAKDGAAANTFKKLYDDIASGEPAAVIDKKLFDDEHNPLWQIFNQDLRQTYIAGDILEDMTKWDARFCTDIGIPNVNIAKASGVGASEVNANNYDTKSKITTWRETITDGLKVCNELFGTDITVRLRWEGVNDDPESDIITNGAV